MRTRAQDKLGNTSIYVAAGLVHCTLLGSSACAHARRLVLAPRPPPRSPPTYDPHSTRCTAACHISRDFVHWRFSAAGRRSAWRDHHSGGRKPAQQAASRLRPINKEVRGVHSGKPACRRPSTILSRSSARRPNLKSGRFERRQFGSTDLRRARVFRASSM
jgi:hypothetical protein